MSTRFCVALDVSACVVVGRANLERCLDTAFRATDVGHADAQPAMLGTVFTVLERVLVAHVTSDPFVEELAGTGAFLRSLEAADVPVFGVGAFAPSVNAAIARRFGWPLSVAPEEPNAGGTSHAMWGCAMRAASGAGFAPDQIIAVSDDAWELSRALSDGCALAIQLGDTVLRGEPLEPSDVVRATSMRDVGRRVHDHCGSAAVRQVMTLRPMAFTSVIRS